MRLISAILLVFLLWPTLPGRAASDNMVWTNDQAMLLFFEAVTQIKKHGIDSPSSGQITADAIKAYMKHHDPYGSYLSPKEYRLWKQAQDYSYHGIGMEIIERDNRVYCLPHPAGPAWTAGIKQGDELLAVEGEKAAGRSIFWVGSRIRGKENTPVRLTISSSQIQQELTISRRPLKDTSVWPIPSEKFNILRISHFSTRTFEEIKTFLRSTSDDKPLILDLRNNPGGDLFAAVDIAGLFLPSGSKILTVNTNQDKTTYTAKGRLHKGKKIVVWQNEFTASASEVLIASLTAHDAAISFGSKSYGKAMTQNVIELSDTSALIISRGRLSGPDETSWQTRGLEPMVRIENSTALWEQITYTTLKNEASF